MEPLGSRKHFDVPELREVVVKCQRLTEVKILVAHRSPGRV